MRGSWRVAGCFVGLVGIVVGALAAEEAVSPSEAASATSGRVEGLPAAAAPSTETVAPEPPRPARDARWVDRELVEAIAWREPDSVMAAIANRSRDDLIVEARCLPGPVRCKCWPEPLESRTVRLRARAVTKMRFVLPSGEHCTRGLSIRVPGREDLPPLARVVEAWSEYGQEPIEHVVRRGAKVTVTRRPPSVPGFELLVTGEPRWLAKLSLDAGAHRIARDSRIRERTIARLVLLTAERRHEELRAFFSSNAGTILASVSGAPITFEIDTSLVTGTVLAPSFEARHYLVEGNKWEGTVELPPILIHERDMEVVSAD